MLYLETEESKKGLRVDGPGQQFYFRAQLIGTFSQRVIHEQKHGVYSATSRFVPPLVETANYLLADTRFFKELCRYQSQAERICGHVTEDRFPEALEESRTLVGQLSRDFNFDGKAVFKKDADPSIH